MAKTLDQRTKPTSSARKAGGFAPIPVADADEPGTSGDAIGTPAAPEPVPTGEPAEPKKAAPKKAPASKKAATKSGGSAKKKPAAKKVPSPIKADPPPEEAPPAASSRGAGEPSPEPAVPAPAPTGGEAEPPLSNEPVPPATPLKPAKQTARRRPAKKAAPVTPRRAPAPVTEWDPVASPLEPTQRLDDPRVKTTMLWPEGLLALVPIVGSYLTITSPVWMAQRGGAPTSAAMKEGLLRLGLKYIDDPELLNLIPADKRRSDAAVEVSVPDPLPPAEPGAGATALPNMDYRGESARIADTTYLTESLVEALALVGASWVRQHPVWVQLHVAPPGLGAFREGLLRLGLKHLNDPELLNMIPSDRRRRA